jgi:hypothetical protein
VSTGITASGAFTQWEACIAANLDPYLWDMGHYPPKVRAKVLAWYEAHELIEQHKQAALAKDAERKARRRRITG